MTLFGKEILLSFAEEDHRAIVASIEKLNTTDPILLNLVVCIKEAAYKCYLD